jgi:gluconokinase
VLPTLSADALILAVDVGSSSVRAMLFDREGNALDNVFAQVRYSPQTTPDGGSTIDSEILCQNVFDSITTALRQAGDHASRIAVVAMDTLVSSLLGVGIDGQPTTPIYTWADTRGGELGEQWTAQLANQGLSPEQYTQITGCRIHTSYWPLRLLWLEAHSAEAFQRTAYWMSLGEYIFYRLTGARQVSASTASWSGLLNRHTLDWDVKTLAALPIRREQLSTISAQPHTTNGDEWARRWPALRQALWTPPVADGAASNIGAGCTVPDRVALSVGTSGAVRVVVHGTPDDVPNGLFAYRVDSPRSLIGGALSNAGNFYAWLQSILKIVDSDRLNQAVAAMEPDSHSLTILPFLAGERAPGWNPAAQAVIMGMTLDTTPEHLVRAGLEAIAYRFAQVADRLKPLLPQDVIYVASGNAILSSPTWMQIMADVLNTTVYATTETETTIRGTVYLATGNERTPVLGQRYTPDPARHAIYSRAIERQMTLYKRLFG